MTWWDDLWLNESFATFISFLCQSQAVKEEYPNTWIAFNNMKGFAYREDQKDTTHPIMADIIDTEKSDSHFDSIVYYKGSSFLKQMFYFIGEENFSNRINGVTLHLMISLIKWLNKSIKKQILIIRNLNLI